jgi:hypothetical protein
MLLVGENQLGGSRAAGDPEAVVLNIGRVIADPLTHIETMKGTRTDAALPSENTVPQFGATREVLELVITEAIVEARYQTQPTTFRA